MALRIGSGLCATKRSNFWSVACRWRRVLKRVYGARGYACVCPHEHHLRRMMAAETLSSDPLSMAALQSVSAAMMAASSLCASSADSTTLHASSLLITSHTPSEATSANSSSMLMGRLTMSAVAGTRGASPSLKRESPMEREHASMFSPSCASTRPSSIVPPSCSMRAFSDSSVALWSFESCTARPPDQSTARESPQLAT
mmetsp:Transcript_348/g.715  ORF Transcript_348/g.715 Transcript_348/m.715 type:complete len:200 (+) Transcript_348:270-869(+)